MMLSPHMGMSYFCPYPGATPLIESDYRADPTDRTLLGHSWAGQFALYMLFQQPHLFQRYVVASAYIDLDAEQKYAAHHDSLPVRLHLVQDIVGGTADPNNEDHSRFTSFVSSMESQQYTGLRLTHQFVLNSTHCAMMAPAFQTGLVAVFA